jgi:hypothetical protein
VCAQVTLSTGGQGKKQEKQKQNREAKGQNRKRQENMDKKVVLKINHLHIM